MIGENMGIIVRTSLVRILSWSFESDLSCDRGKNQCLQKTVDL